MPIPYITHYSYVYTVKGRTYRYRREMGYAKKSLLRKMPLVYVKGFPRHAYPYKFTGFLEWIFAVMFMLLSICFAFPPQ